MKTRQMADVRRGDLAYTGFREPVWVGEDFFNVRIGEMEKRTSTRSVATRYFLASLLFLVVGVRFYYMGDTIGMAIYGTAAPLSLLVAFVYYVREE
jgi:hypothetical protein